MTKTGKWAFLLLCGTALSACSTLPRSGPDDGKIETSAVATNPEKVELLGYALVDVNPVVLKYVSAQGIGTLTSFGGGRGPAPDILIGVGDIVQVSIFESSAGGLFIPAESGTRPGNFVTLPQQEVDRRGNITVPYAGQIPASGRTLEEIQTEIVSRLANRAIEPQAVVALIENKASEVAVLGDVFTPKTLGVSASGDRVLDSISDAGGIRYPGYETFVTLQRRGKKATVSFEALVQRPKENIYVAPGDTIYVYREQRSFVAFGASGLNGKFDFEAEQVSLAEAVAKAGGLHDDRADPRQVFLYRTETRKALVDMGVDVSSIPPEAEIVPTIYRTNFRSPTSFFHAQSFPMRDKDVLYVSNADQVELFKFLGLINGVSSTVAGVADDAATTKSAIKYLAD